MAVGDNNRQPSRPFVLAVPGAVWLAWKEFDGEKTVINTRMSHDNGVSYSKAKPVAVTNDASDHPLIIADGGKVYLSWLTHRDGSRLIALENSR